MGRCAGTRIKNSSHLLRHGPCRAGARRSEHETGGQLGEDGVSGFTMMSVSAQRDQSCHSRAQNNRSDPLKRGRDRFRLSTPSCWLRAGTSRAVSAAADEQPNHDQESEAESEHGSALVAHRNPAETRPALCAQAVEFGTSPLLATHSHFSDVPPQFPDPYRRHSQQPRGPGVLDRKIGVP